MTEFKGQLGNYRIIKTEDNTDTIYSEFFDEACHNLSGAYEETLHNYIVGCEVSDKFIQKKTLHVLDVGFGAGMGLLALLKNMGPEDVLFYYSIELDEALLLWSVKNNLPDLELSKKELHGLTYFEGKMGKNVFISVFLGDGRVTLPLAQQFNLLSPLDVIFQDPFSPKKNPTLWSVEWFLFLKEISHSNVSMATYSSSISIRKSMIRAGWIIENAKGFGKKRTMTRAKLTGTIKQDLLEQLERSPSLEITDK